MLSEISQIEKDKYCMSWVMCRIKTHTHTHTHTYKRNRLTSTENKLAVTREERGGGRGEMGEED